MWLELLLAATVAVHAGSTIAVRGAPISVAVARDAVWVLAGDAAGERLLKLDPAGGRTTATIPLARQGWELGGVAVGAGSVWAAAGSVLFRVDARRGRVVARIRVGGVSAAVFATTGGVWLAVAHQNGPGELVRVDPRTNRVVSRTTVGYLPSSVVLALGSLWVTNTSLSSVMRIDARTGRVAATVLRDRFSSDLAVAGRLVWVAEEGAGLVGGALVALDARARVVRTIRLRTPVIRLAAGGGALWGTDDCACRRGRLFRIDVRTGRVTGIFPVGYTPVDVAAGPDAVWVANFNSQTISRIPL